MGVVIRERERESPLVKIILPTVQLAGQLPAGDVSTHARPYVVTRVSSLISTSG